MSVRRKVRRKVTQPKEITFTTWVNESKHHLDFDLLDNDEWVNVQLKPGEKVTLNSDLDNYIRTEKNGMVIGGKCPFLKKEGEKDVVFRSPHLNVPKLIEEEEIKKAREEAMDMLTREAIIARLNPQVSEISTTSKKPGPKPKSS